jgi:hypothetical protein
MSTGHKKWATGDLVEATAFNSYVQNQIVGVYADSSARDAAFGGTGEPTLAEGMVCYLNDTNELQIYSGSAWVPLLDLDTISVSSGAYTVKGGVTIGEDDTGHDVIVYGDESGSYMMWDASVDDLEFFGNSKINLNGTTVGSSNFQINFAESYNILADNTGTGSDNSRLWFSGNAGGSFYIGPRAGGSLFEDIFLRGDVTVSGALSKGSGSFDIPHPTRGGDWRLRHSFIEGPRADNIYRGTVTLDASGTTTIDLDEDSGMTDGTWEALNTNSWSMVASSGNAVTWDLDGKILTIDGPEGAQCNWMIMAERHDQTVIDWKATNDQGQLIVEYEEEPMEFPEDDEE